VTLADFSKLKSHKPIFDGGSSTDHSGQHCEEDWLSNNISSGWSNQILR